jgi:hypothetical protein
MHFGKMIVQRQSRKFEIIIAVSIFVFEIFDLGKYLVGMKRLKTQFTPCVFSVILEKYLFRENLENSGGIFGCHVRNFRYSKNVSRCLALSSWRVFFSPQITKTDMVKFLFLNF